MNCEQYDAWIASLTQQIAAQNTLITNQTAAVALDYAACVADDILPGGPMPTPVTDAAIQQRIAQVYQYMFDPQTELLAQQVVNLYYQLQRDFDSLGSLQTQLSNLQMQLSVAVQAKAKAGCP